MRQHGLLWLIITVLVFLASPLVVTPAKYQEVANAELAAASRWYGESELEIIKGGGAQLYSLSMVSTGVDPAIRKWFIGTPANLEIAPGTKLPAHLAGWADSFLDYWAGLLNNIYLFCIRLAHSWVWIRYLLPFLAAIIFDGIMTRNAKIESFKYTSPSIYNLSWHSIIGIVCLSVVCFSLTVPISVFYYPFVLTVIGVLIRLVIGNIQHSA